MGGFFYLNAWVFSSLTDARIAARDFLKAHARLLDGKRRESLERAVRLYDQELEIIRIREPDAVFFGPRSSKTIADWTPAVRERERQILTRARDLENRAIAEMEEALP